MKQNTHSIHREKCPGVFPGVVLNMCSTYVDICGHILKRPLPVCFYDIDMGRDMDEIWM